MAAEVVKKDFICNYRQQWRGKRSSGSSEHQHGKRKRWYEQFYSAVDPRGATLLRNKLGWAFKRVNRGKAPQCKLGS